MGVGPAQGYLSCQPGDGAGRHQAPRLPDRSFLAATAHRGAPPYKLLEEASLPPPLVPTDMQGLAVTLSQGDAVEAIMASAAAPGIFATVDVDGAPLMDGAVAANTPLSVPVWLGATRTIIMPTGYASDLQGPPTGAVARALHAITLLIARQLSRDRERLPKNIEIRKAPALCPLDVSPYDFSQSERPVTRETLSTRNWSKRADSRSTRRRLSSHRTIIGMNSTRLAIARLAQKLSGQATSP